MMKKKITNTDRNNALHTLFIEHKIDKIFLPIAAVFVAFLWLSILFNFAVFVKVITVVFVVVLLYFAICIFFEIHDWYKRKHDKDKF